MASGRNLASKPSRSWRLIPWAPLTKQARRGEGRWNCLTVAKDRQGMGRVLYFTSQDLKDWTYRGAVLLSDRITDACGNAPI